MTSLVTCLGPHANGTPDRGKTEHHGHQPDDPGCAELRRTTCRLPAGQDPVHSPAIPVAVVGVAAAAVRVWLRAERPRRFLAVLGLPVLAGLLGIAVALGTVGRAWSGPATLLLHLNTPLSAVVAAGAAVLVNNLPAAALLAARVPPRAYALLVGLNLGPNLFLTGSLAWFLWLRAARTAGTRPSIAHASRPGAIAVPLSIAAALGALALTGAH